MDSSAPECNANGKSKLTRSVSECSPSTGPTSGDGTTLEPSRQPVNGALMLSVEDSPARTLARQTTEEPDWTESEADCGSSIRESFAFCDHDSSLLKTSQRSLFGGLTEYSAILPRAGLMRSGKLFQCKCWARRQSEKGFSLWPTPQASDAKRMQFSREAHLKQQARNKRLGFGTGPAGLNVVVHCQIEFGGVPTANFVEWLMGFPINWTAIEDAETPSAQLLPSGSADES